MKTKFLSIAALAVTALVAAAAALAGGSAKKDDTLSGAGATFPFPLISQWQKDYESKTGDEDQLQPDRLRAAASPRSRPARSTSVRATRR